MKNSYQKRGKHALFTLDIYLTRINHKANRLTTYVTKFKLVSLLSLVMLLGIIHLAHIRSFPKNLHFLPPDTLAYQWIRNVSFSECFAYVLNEGWPAALVYLEPPSNTHDAAFLTAFSRVFIFGKSYIIDTFDRCDRVWNTPQT